MPDQLRQAQIAIAAALQLLEQIDRLLRDLLALFRRERVPAAPVETEHPMEDPPAFERFGNVGVAHDRLLSRARERADTLDFGVDFALERLGPLAILRP